MSERLGPENMSMKERYQLDERMTWRQTVLDGKKFIVGGAGFLIGVGNGVYLISSAGSNYGETGVGLIAFSAGMVSGLGAFMAWLEGGWSQQRVMEKELGKLHKKLEETHAIPLLDDESREYFVRYWLRGEK